MKSDIAEKSESLNPFGDGYGLDFPCYFGTSLSFLKENSMDSIETSGIEKEYSPITTKPGEHQLLFRVGTPRFLE